MNRGAMLEQDVIAHSKIPTGTFARSHNQSPQHHSYESWMRRRSQMFYHHKAKVVLYMHHIYSDLCK